MISCNKIKNIFYGVCASVCMLMLGICAFYINFSNNVYAESSDIPSYLKIVKLNNDGTKTAYNDGDAIFLNTFDTAESSEKLLITLGDRTENPLFALSLLETTTLTIDGINQTLDETSIMNYELADKDFQYFTLSINLVEFAQGEYNLTFGQNSAYAEYSIDDNFTTPTHKSFTTTFYVLKTSEYFDDQNSQKVNYNNVTVSTNDTGLYKNYYYFNYSNVQNLTDASYLPTLSFDSNKFKIEISKSINGIKQILLIDKSIFSTTTFIDNIVFASINGDNITICFSDIGDYEIKYTFIYKDVNVILNGDKIAKVNQENDILYVFGYQMFYYGNNQTRNNEFKDINTDTYTCNDSADISYLIPKETLTTNNDTETESDTAIITAISGKTAVNTNQPAITTKTNTTFKKAYYYTLEGTEFVKHDDYRGDIPFTTSGTYLLKFIYQYDNYNISSGTFFVQYFYFTITNTTPNIIVKDSDEITLNTGSYTNKNVRVQLPEQSKYNSDISAKIFAKSFSGNFDLTNPDITLNSRNNFADFSESKNYKVVVNFGKNNNTILYFNIDKLEISNILVCPTTKTSSNFEYDENNNIDFFTSENVVLQWDEKASGASSSAYYKYIPFKKVSDIANSSKGDTYFDLGSIPTDYELDFQNELLSKTPYKNAGLSYIVNSNQVFTNQGFYIVRITDEAGNTKLTSFCIDRTNLKIWQYSVNEDLSAVYVSVQNYNVVSVDSTLQWGSHKLIKLNIAKAMINDLVDADLKEAIKSLNNESDNSHIKIDAFSNNLYFQVKISDYKVLQIGNTITKINNKDMKSYNVKIMTEGANSFANEITYIIYLIDESNLFYKSLTNLTSPSSFIENASAKYSITTSTDVSQTNILINPINTSNDNLANIDYNCYPLVQAGFADSQTTSTTTDLRSKYFMSTGVSGTQNIAILTYIFKPVVENVIVDKVTMYYYPFVAVNGIMKLSENCTSDIIYQYGITDISRNTLTGDFAGFLGFNVNSADYNLSNSTYNTQNGKYVFVREYTSTTILKENDFKYRENIFIVDREEIVSNPQSYTDSTTSETVTKSFVGGDIFINILDGSSNPKSIIYNDIYASKYNTSYIFQTNKLPVVVYVPISKYGQSNTEDKYLFNSDSILSYYLQIHEKENLIRYQDEDKNNITSKLTRIYFGNEVVLTKFDEKYSSYSNSSFDLSIKITNAKGETFTYSKLNSYIKSTPLLSAGTYYVEIIQNSTQGTNYPNVYQTYKFSFQIIEQPPAFVFTDVNSTAFNTDINGVAYTNKKVIRVTWTDTTNELYMAKIDITSNPSNPSYANGIRYYLNNGTSYQYVPILSITTTGKSHYFDIVLPSQVKNGDILTVYMQYEGYNSSFATNYPSYAKATSISKRVCIDLNAPTNIINSLIQTTNINNLNFAGNTMHYLDLVENEEIETDTLKSYYIRKTKNDLLANYYFALAYDQRALTQLFSTQIPVSNYYTEGAYYYISQITNTFVPTSLTNAMLPLSSKISASNLQANTYYEIIEKDYAGNITIYNIFLVPNFTGNNVIEYINNGTNSVITYEDLQSIQDIYSIHPFALTNINLNNYEWLTFSVKEKSSAIGTTYFSTPELNDLKYYNFSNYSSSNISLVPINLSDINTIFVPSETNIYELKVLGPSKIINGKIESTSYTFNIYVINQDSQLTIKIINNPNGIRITEENNIAPTKIKIYSYENSQYTEIYNKSSFVTDSYITYTKDGNEHTFLINDVTSNVAFKYEIYDNFGRKILRYHTVNSTTLLDSQKIIGYDGMESITVNGISENWYIGLGNILYNYNYLDYFAYIDFQYLQFNSTINQLEWTSDLIGGLNYTAGLGYRLLSNQTTRTDFFISKESSLGDSIYQIELLKLAGTKNLLNYNGGIIKFVITLVNSKESSMASLENVKINILINTLEPKIILTDRNNEDITSSLLRKTGEASGTISSYSGQVTIKYGNVNFASFTSKADVEPFIFKINTTLTNLSLVSQLTNGSIVEEPGTYVIKNLIKIGTIEYLINSYTFIISEASNAFYTVVALNTETQEYEIVNNTNVYYTDPETKLTYKHYIVNSNYNILVNSNEMVQLVNYKTNIQNQCVTTIYLISNLDSTTSDRSIRFIHMYIAITYVPKPAFILPEGSIKYTYENGNGSDLTKEAQRIILTKDDESDSITIKYNAYYGIPENNINVKIYYGDGQSTMIIPNISYEYNGTAKLAKFTIKKTGVYYLYFEDLAGNKQTFASENRNNIAYYQITFIKGVAYLINGLNPIENGVYNDKITITLPSTLKSVYDYDVGGKPSIKVFRNGVETALTSNTSGEYIITTPGFYKVYFDANIDKVALKEESYEFSIISSNEYFSSFEYSQFGNYEITKILKNGIEKDYTAYFNGDNKDATTIKHLSLNVYDEMTGAGEYTITIATNSEIAEESFEFNVKLSPIRFIPISISSEQNQSTTNPISISFNAFNLYSEIGECKVVFGTNSISINKEYINSLTPSNYYQTYTINETGTYFVQVYSNSDNLLYSYKVIKTEPLNTVSIILIVVAVGTVVALAVTISLLRRKMKVR